MISVRDTRHPYYLNNTTHGVNSSDKYVNSDCLPICELRVVHINYANELASQFRFTK